MGLFDFSDALDKIVEEYREQVRKALKVAEQKIRIKMQEIIQEYMLDDYYNGYTPKMYVRINQLQNSVGPYTELKEQNNAFAIGFGIETGDPYGPDAMDHSLLILNVQYKRKKSSGTWESTYTYDNNYVDEKIIFENFLAGIHPNVGNANTRDITERVSRRLSYFLDYDAIDIVNAELNKIK